MTEYGYARVSTLDQHPETQVDLLRAAGLATDNIRVEYASGACKRPVLKALMMAIGPGDTLVVTKLDRLGRSLFELLSISQALSAQAVELRSLGDGWDTSTASGRMVFSVLGALAEYERSLISERTKLGLQTARRRGARIGRPPSLSAAQQEEVVELRRQGWSLRLIAGKVGASRATVRRVLVSHAAAADPRQQEMEGRWKQSKRKKRPCVSSRPTHSRAEPICRRGYHDERRSVFSRRA